MIKKTIPYKDHDGNDRVEDFWFQITKAEFIKKALVEGGEAYLEKLRSLADLQPDDMRGKGREIMDIFETLLADSVGKREGELFIKNKEIRDRFLYSGAYDQFFLDLLETPDSGAVFMRNIMPRDAHQAIDEALAEKQKMEEGEPIAAAAGRPMTDAEVQEALSGPSNAEPTPFPQSLETAVEANKPVLTASAPVLEEPSKDDRPDWLKEMREPTQKELLAMPRDEMSLAFRLREEGKLNVANKVPN